MLAPLVALAVAAAPAAPAPAPLHAQPRSTVDPASPAVLAGEAGPVLTLDAALREGEAKSPTLAVARARLDQARAGIARAWAGQLPQVSASASATHNSTESRVELPVAFEVQGTPPAQTVVPTQVVEATIQPRNQLAAQLDASLALFAPPVWYGVRAAKAGAASSEESSEAARREVAFGIAQVYYGAAALKQTIAVQARQVAIALQHEKDAQVRYDAGATPKITLLRAQIDRARAEQDLKRAENSYRSSKVSLATLIERPDTAFEVEVPKAPEVPADADALEAGALRDRPDVRAAALAVDAQEAARRALVATYLPTVGAFGRWQVSNAGGFSGANDVWAVGLSASWNLFDGGLREAQLREASGRIAEAGAARRGVEDRAKDEVRRARLDLDSAVANRTKAEEQRRLAVENQRLVEVNFRAGAATYLEVSDANLALTSAENAVVSEGLNADLAALRLLQASGRFATR